MSLHLKLSRSPLLPLPPHPEIELATSPSSPLPSPPPTQVDPLDRSQGRREPRAGYTDAPSEDEDPVEGEEEGEDEEEEDQPSEEDELALVRRERGERWFALFVACLLSVGSHYGTHLLGPIKSRVSREMGASNSQFSLLLAALSLNNTWTPLVGGLLTARLGTPLASIMATSLILIGQATILFFTSSGANGEGSIKGMLLGIWIFSLGVSPLAVVQETIIVRYFSHKGLGLSLALGLVVGKGASFVSAITSYPLSERFGRRGPFVASTLLASVSFAANIFYCVVHYRNHRTLSSDTPSASLDPDEIATEKVLQRRRVRFTNLSKLGDSFWIFILLNIFSGAIWSPFLQLSSNLIQRRYLLSDATSASYASLLLAFSIVLYPMAGWIHDHFHTDRRDTFIVYRLFVLASCLTLSCFVWLVLPVVLTRSPVPAMIAFGGGHGFATLLLVLVVPGLVEKEWVSTALGAHKSMESAATTLTQTLSGLLLDASPKIHLPTFPKPTPPSNSSSILVVPPSSPPQDIPPDTTSTHLLLLLFLLLNVLQLATTIFLWRTASSRLAASLLSSTTVTPNPNSDDPPSTSLASDGYAPLPKEEEDRDELDLEEERLPPPASTSLRTSDDLPSSPASVHSTSSLGPLRNKIRTLSASSRRPLISRTRSGRDLSAGGDGGEGCSSGGLGVTVLGWAERRRGRWFFFMSLAFVFSSWAVFGGVAIWRLEGTR
ncbi:major facilitator superfamily domain-containing protein [Mrakia frigida]|uniref:major facilitator superfamily domain-containing protein n=1 Tax=Mrakia frigida TaxID=29902 RepID=UPI003FCC06DC